MNSTALLILGVKYAILLGLIGALLNMLPYIGGIIAIALPILMATVTKNGYSTQLLMKNHKSSRYYMTSLPFDW